MNVTLSRTTATRSLLLKSEKAVKSHFLDFYTRTTCWIPRRGTGHRSRLKSTAGCGVVGGKDNPALRLYVSGLGAISEAVLRHHPTSVLHPPW